MVRGYVFLCGWVVCWGRLGESLWERVWKGVKMMVKEDEGGAVGVCEIW